MNKLPYDHNPKNPPKMKPDPMTLKLLLKKRENELHKIIRQMKQDNLHSSPVYKNLELELETVKTQLSPTSDMG